MKGIALSCLCLFGLTILYSQTLEVLTFEYPPLMGNNAISKTGVISELVDAAFRASGVAIHLDFLPTGRAITQIDKGEAPVMIGLMEYFSEESKKHLSGVPIMAVDFYVFYLKERFPDSFEYHDIRDLTPYTVGVLLNGATDIYGRKMGIRVEPAASLPLVFKKLSQGRTDLCLSNDLAGLFQIATLFPRNCARFDYSKKVPFLSQVATAIFNTNHPDFAVIMPKFRKGMETIVQNGTWAAIIRRYYPGGIIPESSKRILKEFASLPH